MGLSKWIEIQRKRKALVLIGIVCDAEINSFIILNSMKDKT